MGRHTQAGDLRSQEGALSAVSGETGRLWGWNLVQTEGAWAAVDLQWVVTVTSTAWEPCVQRNGAAGLLGLEGDRRLYRRAAVCTMGGSMVPLDR